LLVSLDSRVFLVCLGIQDPLVDKETMVLLELMEKMGWMDRLAFQVHLETEERLERMEVLEFRV